MEGRDYQESFEDFLQEKADQYKLYPSDRVWNAINNKLHPRSKWSYLVVAAAFLGLGIGGKVYDSSLVDEPLTYNSADAQFLSDGESAAKVIPMSSKGGKRMANLPSNISTGTPNTGFIAARTPTGSNSNGIKAAVPENGSIITENPASAKVIVSSLNPGVEAANAINGASGVETIQNAIVETVPETPVWEEAVAESAPSMVQETIGNEILDQAALEDALESDARKTMARATVSNATKKEFSVSGITAPEKANSIKVLKPRQLKLGWQLYASPTVSYRKLSGEGMSYYNNSSLNSVFTADVEKSVRHKPAIGFELGTALTYATGPNFRFKTGVQLNINRYDIEAFSYVPEVAPLTRGGIGHTTINAISRFRNDNGFSKTWLKNQHIMMSLPLGAEITLFGSENVKFNIGGTLQPTFVLNNQAYMISTNMKNYAQEPSLYKRFNVAAGAEAYLSIKSRSFRWMVGPQFRYQIFSSYKKEYPINEHLTDYGFKIGISR